MMRNKHTSSAVKHSAIYAIGIGAVISVVISIALTALLTSFVINRSIGESNTSIYIFLIRSISVFLGSILGAAIGKEKYLQTIGCITLCYLVVLLSLGITLYDGSFQHFGSGIISSIIGGLVAYLIQMRPRGNRKHTAKFGR